MRQFLVVAFLFIFVNSSFSQTYHNEWIDYSKTYYKFKVGSFGTDAVNGNAILKKGIVRIPYSTIATAGMGGTPSQHFQLWRDGEEIPLYVSKPAGSLGSSDFIEFWGEVNNGRLDAELYRDPSLQLSDYWSLQTDTAAYFLTINTENTNKRYQEKTFDLSGNTLTPAPFFMHTVGRYFRTELLGGFSAVAGQNIYSSSYDMGEGFASRAVRPNNCGSQQQLPQSFPSLFPYTGTTELPAPSMIVRLNTVGNAANARTVKILLNNDSITRYQMDYFYDYKVEEYVSVNKISSGTASFIMINESNGNCDQFRVSMIELCYPRLFNFNNAATFSFSLKASPVFNQYVEITNFNNGGVAPVIYDLANQKRYVGDISTAGKIKILLDPSSMPYNLVINSQAGANYKTINTLQTRNFINFETASNQGDYLIISNPLIYGSGNSNYVQQYSDYRSSAAGGSFDSKIVDINELVDQFAWGIKKHPLSVKNFLKYARKNFLNTPKYVFLLGKGLSYNAYRNNETDPLADQLNLVPTWGSPASDNILSSADLTALPETPIGRLSVITPAEVGSYLQKVKQYDSAQASPIQTIESKSWMKNVIQIAGANDLGLGDQLDGYLNNYKTIISDTAFGAKVTNFSKNADPAGYTDAVLSFKKTYEQGSSLITYFGHSSSTSLDFNLDKPEEYNNQSKYPLFIANGCNAGNNFDFETNRFNSPSTISERFIVSSQRGAIGYLATTSYGVVNYLNMYTTQFYKAFAKTKYSQTFGIAIKEGIRATLQSTGAPDFFSRVHAEQYALNGDPALKLNSLNIPDYAVGEPQIEVSPSFISVADTSFMVKVKVYNLGRSTNDSVSFKLNRITPAGQTTTILTKRLAPLKQLDSVTASIKVLGITNSGINKIVAIVDYDNQLTELTKENNSATKEILISEDEIRPIYPFNNSIVNTANFKFQGSTVNPLSVAKNYVMEIDTTERFNSASKKSVTVNSKGGVIDFDPSISLVNNTVYYWRIAPENAVLAWRKASFKYEQGEVTGYEQSGYYQHANATFKRIYLDSADRKFKFDSRVNNLFIVNSIYPTSGTEDSHFSVSVNGNSIIASACDGPVFQFNVFNPITFEPWKNVTTAGVGLYGSGASDCGVTRQYNFEYRTYDSASRRKAMQFMDMIPKGYYVVVRTVSSPQNNINAYAAAWKLDTLKYGAGNSIYHRLRDAGFAIIDSFNRAKTFSFVYKKQDTSFTPKYAMSDGVNDRINLDVNCPTPNTSGQITSINYGPAKAWKRVKWAGSNLETDNDEVKLRVYGFTKQGADTLIYELPETQKDFDISAIDAKKYRYLKLAIESRDDVTATPFQLDYFKVEYEAAPEGGLAPNLFINFPDTLQKMEGRNQNSSGYSLAVAFKNASKVAFDSLKVKVVLYDVNNNAIVFDQPKTRPLPAGDTLQIEVQLDATKLLGNYNVYLEVNPDNDQLEQVSFNNFMYKMVYIEGGQNLPVDILWFNATLQQNNVSASWLVANENMVANYIVEHGRTGEQFVTLGSIKGKNNGLNTQYQYLHSNAPLGKNYYRLKIIDNDGKFKYSPVRLVNIGTKTSVNLYPNPVKNLLNITISRQDGMASTVKLMNSFGQQLEQRIVSGTSQIDLSKYASGLYLLQVDDGVNVTTYKIQKQ